MEEVKKQIREFLNKNKVDMNKLSDDDNLFKSGYVDSLFALQLVIFVEKSFKIKILNKDLKIENFSSVEIIAKTVLRIQGKEA